MLLLCRLSTVLSSDSPATDVEVTSWLTVVTTRAVDASDSACWTEAIDRMLPLRVREVTGSLCCWG